MNQIGARYLAAAQREANTPDPAPERVSGEQDAATAHPAEPPRRWPLFQCIAAAHVIPSLQAIANIGLRIKELR